jgi:hypothetical protein
MRDIVVRKMEMAEEMMQKAASLQVEVRTQLESSFGLATAEAIATLQQFKPPK